VFAEEPLAIECSRMTVLQQIVISPQKSGAFKNREFGYELLILKGRKNDETT